MAQLDSQDRIVTVKLTRRQLDILIQGIKSGRVEFTERAALLAKLENGRDTEEYGQPLVKRDPYVGGPTEHRYGRD